MINFESYLIPINEPATEGVVGKVLGGAFVGLIALSVISDKIVRHKKAKTLSEYYHITEKMVDEAKEIKLASSGKDLISAINVQLPPIISEFNSTVNNFNQSIRSANNDEIKIKKICDECKKKLDRIQEKCQGLIKLSKNVSTSNSHDIDVTDNKSTIQKFVGIGELFKYPEADDDLYDSLFVYDFYDVYDKPTNLEIHQAIDTISITTKILYKIYNKGLQQIKLRLK